MNKRIGISIYPSKAGEQETIEYIKLAHKNGINRIFANLLNVENNREGKENIASKTRVFKAAKDLGFEVILDVAPSVYKAFKIPQNDLKFFYDMNATGIRLDENFGGEIEAKLSRNDLGMKIELNASMNSDTAKKALENNASKKTLMMCHNFYPMKYTGLKFERFSELNDFYHKNGLVVSAFVTLPKDNNGIGPWPENDGMPTIELHRTLPIEDQIRHFLSLGNISDIIISQQPASEQQLKKIKEIIDPEVDVTLKFKETIDLSTSEKTILNYKTHFNRPDINGFFIRSTMTRVVYKDMAIEPRFIDKPRLPGQVYIGNDKFGRYKGELHIVTKKMQFDERLNYVGTLRDFDTEHLLENIKSGTKFKII